MGAKAAGWAVDYRDAFQSPWTKPLWIKRGVHSFGLHNPLEYVKNEMLLFRKPKILQAFFFFDLRNLMRAFTKTPIHSNKNTEGT